MNLFNRSHKQHSAKRKKASFLPGTAVDIQAALAQSPGKAREHMEDAASSMIFQQGACGQERRTGLFVIADGMGGHLNGELASCLAVKVLNERMTPLLQAEQDHPVNQIEEQLTAAFEGAQKEILTQVSGGGTTLTAALVINKTLYFAHVGDSRLYWLDCQGKPEVLTRDHSLVQRLVDLGQISKADAEVHPQKNVLYRALGQTDGFKVDLGYREMEAPGYLLVCSDGLWSMVEERKLASEVCADRPLSERAHNMVEMANQAGGPDNISVILVEIS